MTKKEQKKINRDLKDKEFIEIDIEKLGLWGFCICWLILLFLFIGLIV